MFTLFVAALMLLALYFYPVALVFMGLYALFFPRSLSKLRRLMTSKKKLASEHAASTQGPLVVNTFNGNLMLNQVEEWGFDTDGEVGYGVKR